MSKVKYFDSNYSTTRLLTKEKPVIENKTGDKLKSVLFLPEAESREGEGGLRIKGYFKKSYENKPLITVVTVVFNGEKYLEKTIQSIINQDYDNVEYVIIDGGSTDNTIEIIKRYENQIDYWVSEPDGGIYDAMNKGITLATGEWINFMNVGDKLHTADTLSKIYKFTKHDKSTVLYGNVLCVYDLSHCITQQSKSLETIYQGMPFSHQSSFVKSKYLKRYGFDLQYSICADYDLMFKLYTQGLIFEPINIVIADYDMYGKSTSFSRSFLQKKEISNRYDPSKNSYFTGSKYLKFKIKDIIKSYLSQEIIKKIKTWLSKNIYHRGIVKDAP